MQEETVHKLRSQQKLENECEEPDVLPKVNIANVMGMMVAIKEYLRSCHVVKIVPLALSSERTQSLRLIDTISWWQNDQHDVKLPTEQIWLYREKETSSKKQHTTACKIDNRSIYGILDQICKDTDLYQHIKQNKSRWYHRGSLYAILPGAWQH